MTSPAVEGFRLSPHQRHLWPIQKDTHGGAAYRVRCVMRVEGLHDAGLLKAALMQVVDRHEILRTRFVLLAGMTLPVQVIAESNLSWDEDNDLREAQRGDENAPAPDFEHDPPLRARLVRLPEGKYAVLLSLPALCADEATLRNLVREVAVACCESKESGTGVLQYADIAEWQNELLDSEAGDAERAYWRNPKSPNLLTCRLPFEMPPAGECADFSPAWFSENISGDVFSGAREVAARHGESPAAFFLTCWQILLCRLCQQSVIAVGVGFDNRDYEELQRSCGPLKLYAPVASQYNSQQTFLDLLSQTTQSLREVSERQRYFSWENLDRPAEHNSATFSPVCFDYHVAAEPFTAGNISVSIASEYACTDRFQLKLVCRESAPGELAEFELHYDAALISETAIRPLADQFGVLLHSAVTTPDAAVGDLGSLGERERRQLVVAVNQTETPYASDRCFHHLFEEQAARTPNAPAAVYQDQQVTYGELNARANRLAARLRTMGVGPEVLAAIYMERSVDIVVAVIALLKAGGGYVPLDPTHPRERTRFTLADAGVRLLLTQSHLRSRLDAGTLPVWMVDSEPAPTGADRDANVATAVGPDNLAYVIYTSGSTGRPKGVAVQHRSILNLLAALDRLAYSGCPPGLRATFNAPLSFDASMQQLVLLLRGHTLHIVPEITRVDGASFMAFLRRHRIDALDCTPSHLRSLVASGLLEVDQPVPSIVLVAGEAIDRTLWRSLAQAPRTRFYSIYGPTECTVDSTGCLIEGEFSHPVIGLPLANYRTYVLAANLSPVATYMPGELYIGGAGLARGYVARPDLTGEKFVPDPFGPEPGGRLYRTGDLARFLPDGSLEFLGRADHQVKLRGYRIELGEIETQLEQHEAVSTAVVVALRSNDPAQETRLVAYVVPRTGRVMPAVEEIRRFLAAKLPFYMLPVLYVTLASLPLLPNGKVDRLALPAPEAAATAHSDPPRTHLEDVLATIWAEVLQVDRVGVEENFFELGGNSLQATQLVARARNVLGVDLPLRSVFHGSTIAKQAALVETTRRERTGVQLPRLEARQRESPVPLSFAQQRLWFLDQLDPGIAAYNVSGAIRIEGVLDVGVLERSLREIVARHEALRTTFELVDRQPVQVVRPLPNWRMTCMDLRELPPEQRKQEMDRLAKQEAARSFDLTADPLLRASLLQLDAQNALLVLTMHHIASDGWSVALLARETAALYQAFADGKPSPLPTLPVQYGDFALWQRDVLQSDGMGSLIDYWRKQLADAPPALKLPTDRPHPPVQTHRGATERFIVPAVLVSALKRIERREGTTLFMTLLAAFQALLHRYSGENDIIVGSPAANRSVTELEDLIGLFANTLVLRTDFSGKPTFRELLAQVRKTTVEAYVHQDLPFERLVEELQPERKLSHNPIFQVMFVLQNAPMPTLDLPNLRLTPVDLDSGIAKFDLTLFIFETGQGLDGVVSYNTDLFDADTISRLIGHFRTLLDAIVANPDQRISEYSILTLSERTAYDRYNATRMDHPKDMSIHRLIESQVSRMPESIAVSDEYSSLTYLELNRRAGLLAARLRLLGVGAEDLVGVCLERSVDLVVAVLGILKSGAAFLPLEPRYPPDRLRYMLDDARPRVILGQSTTLGQLPVAGIQVLSLDRSTEQAGHELEAEYTSTVGGDHAAYVIYTSGSTGRPKAVVNTHVGVCNRLLSMQDAYHLDSTDSLLQKAPISFDVSVWELFWPLTAGALLVTAKPDGHRDSAYLVNVIAKHAITTVAFVPSMLRIFLQERGLDRCRSIRRVLCGGEALPFEVQERFFSCLSAELHNRYGPAEAAIYSVAWRCRPKETVMIGRPIGNTQVYVLDRYGQLAPVGITGELYIGGVGVARGYLNWPDLTAEKFVPDPFGGEHGGRLYRTGDIGRMRSDGALEYVGRRDGQVKLRGNRIELGEVEAVLSEHPGVQAAVAAVRGDALVAYVVSNPLSPTAAALREFLACRLPEYMLPTAYAFMNQLPVTANGKLDRSALPNPTDRALKAEYLAPRTPTERELARIWSEVLGIGHDVGIQDDFFALGGHSLSATRVVAALRERLKISLPLRDLFESPSLGALAERVEAAMRASEVAEPVSASASPRDGPAPLSYAQQRLWFLEQWEPGTAAYNISAAIRLSGTLDDVALERSVSAIVRRHAALRTTLATSEGRPMQIVAAELTMPLPRQDVRGLPEEQRQSEIERLAREEARTPFDLVRGPLFRLRLLRLDEGEQLLLLTIHHVICDAWSMGIFGRELAALYRAEIEGGKAELPALPLQYTDYARWQRQWLTEERLEAHLQYWRQQLQGVPPLLKLPTDRPRPAVQNTEGATHPLRLADKLTAALKHLAQAEKATFFMILLAGFQALLHRYTGQDDLVIGTDVAGRERAEFEPMIGFFVNQLVLRANLSGDPSFRTLLGRTRQVALDAYTHQALPFDLLVQHLKPTRDPSYSPLFQVKLFLVHEDGRGPDFPGLTIDSREIDSGSARLDLTIGLWDSPKGVHGWINYSTRLFDSATMQRIASEFVALLSRAVAFPDATLSELTGPPLVGKSRSALEQRDGGAAPRHRFQRVTPKLLSLTGKDLITCSFLETGRELPLVIEPKSASVDLAGLLAANRSWIETELGHHGAILFRGFGIDSAERFERAAYSICLDLFSENAEHVPLSPDGKVQSPVFYAPYKKLLWHNENSFNRTWPMMLFFGCLQPPSKGGETPLVDCRQMFRCIPADIRRRFIDKQVMYVRTLGTGLGLDWRVLFRTEDRGEVEAACRRESVSFEWLDGDCLQTRAVRPACHRHAATNEMVWFAQLQHWHTSCHDPETRESLLSVCGPDRLPRNCFYGDGSEICDEVMSEICQAYQNLEATFLWRRGDLLLLDNMLTAHARNPYAGERQIIVTMGAMAGL